MIKALPENIRRVVLISQDKISSIKETTMVDLLSFLVLFHDHMGAPRELRTRFPSIDIVSSGNEAFETAISQMATQTIVILVIWQVEPVQGPTRYCEQY
jgi:hypothetical protein